MRAELFAEPIAIVADPNVAGLRMQIIADQRRVCRNVRLEECAR